MDELEQIIPCPNCDGGWIHEVGLQNRWRQCPICEARGFLMVDCRKTLARPMMPVPKRTKTGTR